MRQAHTHIRDEAAAGHTADACIVPDSEEPQPGGSTTQLPLLQVANQQADHFSQVQLIMMPDGSERFEVHCNLPGFEDLVGRFSQAEQCTAWQQELLCSATQSPQ